MLKRTFLYDAESKLNYIGAEAKREFSRALEGRQANLEFSSARRRPAHGRQPAIRADRPYK